MFAAYDDPRIALVVLEQNVVARLVGLDERVFEQQGIRFAVHDDVADLGDLAHQHAYLGAVLLALHEIGRDALAQALGFAHVDDPARPVQKLIDPGCERQQRHLFFQAEPVFVVVGHNRKQK